MNTYSQKPTYTIRSNIICPLIKGYMGVFTVLKTSAINMLQYNNLVLNSNLIIY